MAAASKEDIKYGAAQAKVTDGDMLRTGYINGTPLEGGKIADSQPVDLFSHARRVADTNADSQSQPVGAAPSQQQHEAGDGRADRPVVDAAWAAKPS